MNLNILLSALGLAVEAEDGLSAHLSDRRLEGRSEDALDLSDRLARAEELRDLAADIMLGDILNRAATLFGLLRKVSSVGITGNTGHLADELGRNNLSGLGLRTLGGLALNLALRSHCVGFDCGSHIVHD